MIDPAECDALTFDCYGTIIDWEQGILDALIETRRRYAIELGDEAVLAAFARAEAERERQGAGKLYPVILAEVYRDLMEAWGVVADEAAAQEFGASIGDWPPFDDSAKALKKLGEKRLLAVLSNVDRASFAKTAEALGIEFGEVMTAEEIGSYKPDPRNFEFALARLAQRGIPRERVVHVAQSLYHDHVPAQALGMKTVWVDRRAGRSGPGASGAADVSVVPDLVVKDLAELAEWFA